VDRRNRSRAGAAGDSWLASAWSPRVGAIRLFERREYLLGAHKRWARDHPIWTTTWTPDTVKLVGVDACHRFTIRMERACPTDRPFLYAAVYDEIAETPKRRTTRPSF
jgi:hypothetical protein